MAPQPALVKGLRFIEAYQRQRPDKPSARIVRDLRAYTKPSYASIFVNVLGMGARDNPEFISGGLDNEDVVLTVQAAYTLKREKSNSEIG